MTNLPEVRFILILYNQLLTTNSKTVDTYVYANALKEQLATDT
jgi:hypothetical protein